MTPMAVPKVSAARKPITGPSSFIRSNTADTNITGGAIMSNRHITKVTMVSITVQIIIPMSLSLSISLFFFVYSNAELRKDRFSTHTVI